MQDSTARAGASMARPTQAPAARACRPAFLSVRCSRCRRRSQLPYDWFMRVLAKMCDRDARRWLELLCTDCSRGRV